MAQAGKWTKGMICFPRTPIYTNGHHHNCSKTIQIILLSNKENFPEKD